jgi:ribulose-5-phosphate 4-epimerase/fuculose-1-phosphate aldolase
MVVAATSRQIRAYALISGSLFLIGGASRRVPRQQNHFLINPYSLLFDEITASSLVKIDAEGNKVEPSEAEVNSGGFAIPSTVHMARPEVACVLHIHSAVGCAVSMQREGLLPLNQHALQIIGDVAYHAYEGTGRNLDERARLWT